jgi:hypothetical protein
VSIQAAQYIEEIIAGTKEVLSSGPTASQEMLHLGNIIKAASQALLENPGDNNIVMQAIKDLLNIINN